jgi:hypothetical protein
MALHVNLNLALESVNDFAPAPDNSASANAARAELAAQFIRGGSRVLDLGGAMELMDALPGGCGYQGVDVRERGGNAIVCDLAAGDFPTKAAAQSDVIVMLGVLERITDVENLFTHLRFCKQDLILSYRPSDLGGAPGQANHLSFYDLATLFDRYGFRIECTAPVDACEMLMRLTPADRLRPVAPCSVAVIS